MTILQKLLQYLGREAPDSEPAQEIVDCTANVHDPFAITAATATEPFSYRCRVCGVRVNAEGKAL